MTENLFVNSRKRSNKSDAILYHIQKNPGIHLRGICKELAIPLGTLRHRLETLEKTGQIISERYGSGRHYFISGFFQEHERPLLNILGKKTPRLIVTYLVRQDNPVSISEIAGHTKISNASTAWNVKELVNLGMVLESNDGRYKKYQLKSTEITNLLKIYYKEN